MSDVKRLFVDIETSPNIVWSWRIGNRLSIPYENIIKERKIICVACKWDGIHDAFAFVWDDKQNDKQLLKSFLPILHEADEVVAHNGSRFDVPWIRTRCAIHGISMRPDIPVFDTLQKARRGFNFNSNRLDYLASILGTTRKAHAPITLWTNATFRNDRKAMWKLVDYCIQDVMVLQKVYAKLARYTTSSVHHGVHAGGTKSGCPRCGASKTSLVKTRTTARGTITRQMQCKKCHSYFTLPDAVYKKGVRK